MNRTVAAYNQTNFVLGFGWSFLSGDFMVYLHHLNFGGGGVKPFLPYNILLVLAVLAMGLMVSYNLSLRQNFGVAVGYALPRPVVSQPKQEQASIPQNQYELPPEEPPAQELEPQSQQEWEETSDTVVVLATFPLDLNKADVYQLMYIPKIGSATAQRIVQYRTYLGSYTRLEQLKDIQGIGDKTFDAIAPYLFVEDEGIDDTTGDSQEENHYMTADEE